MQPLFSIISPTYNRASFISRAIQSVIDQEYANWELLIIDDGSTDDTEQVVATFSDDRIKYHWQENAERSVARNKGVELAQGTFICFLDSDDRYLPNHLAILDKFIKSTKQRKAAFITQVCRDTGGGLQEEPAFCKVFSTDIDNVLVQPVMTSRICLHREVARDFPFDPTIRISEDRELLVRVATKYPIYSLPEWTVVYEDHAERTVNLNTEKNHQANIELVNQLIKEHKQISRKAGKLALAAAWYNLGQEYARLGKRIKSAQAFLQSSLYLPAYKLKRKVALLLGKG